MWRTIRRATATSVALLAGAAAASAQAPAWDTTAPARTQWANFPPTVAAPNAKVATPTTPESAPIGTRVILFQKPAEGQPDPKPGDPNPKMIDPKSTGAESPKLNPGEPKRDEVFRMMGDDELQGKPAVVIELVRKSNKLPPPPPIPPYEPRTGTMPSVRLLLEPGYVVHRRLYFEDKNSERYGWDAGFVQPLLSLGIFYKDVLLYPAKLGSNRRERYETNAGKYMPGSPVPYLLYPPEITVGGYILGAVAIGGAAFLVQ